MTAPSYDSSGLLPPIKERKKKYKGHRFKSRLSTSLPTLLPSIPDYTYSSTIQTRRYEKISFSMKLSKDLKPAPTAGTIPFPAILRRGSTLINMQTKARPHKTKSVTDTALKIVNTADRTLAYTEEDGKVKVAEFKDSKLRPHWDLDCHCGRCQKLKEKWDGQDQEAKAPYAWERQKEPYKFHRRNYSLITKTWDGLDPLT